MIKGFFKEVIYVTSYGISIHHGCVTPLHCSADGSSNTATKKKHDNPVII